MKKRFGRAVLFPWLISLYLALFFSVVIPFHHHADCAEHQDSCVICAINHTPALAGNAIHLVLSFLVVSFLIPGVVFLKSFRRERLHLRSPPAF